MKSLDDIALEFCNLDKIESFGTKNNAHTDLLLILKKLLISYDTISPFPIKIIVCNTFNKFSYILPINFNKKHVYYIVFDEYLMEINSIFNNLFFLDSPNESDIWKLSYKLLSEDYYLNGDNLIALYLALNENALGEFITNKILVKNEFWYKIQQTYIFAHEYGHLKFLLEKDKEEAIGKIKLTLFDAINKYIDTNGAYSKLIAQMKSTINKNDSILEECFCDLIAYSYIITNINSEYSSNQNMRIEAIKALYICLLNMNILSICNLTREDNTRYEIFSAIRYGFFMEIIGKSVLESDKDVLLKSINDCANHYEKNIANVILPCLSTLYKRIKNLEGINIGCRDIARNNRILFKLCEEENDISYFEKGGAK